MTTLATSPVQGDLLDELALIGDTQTSLGQDHYEAFLAACRADAAHHDGYVNPSRVRARLMTNGELQIEPRAFSAYWSKACGKDGPMVKTEELVPITGAGSRGNTNKSTYLRRWVG